MNILNIRRDATADRVAMFVRVLEPLLDGRIVRVLLVRKDRLVTDSAALYNLTFPSSPLD